MELHSLRKTSLYSGLGEEKHQMLDLNRRLETYLSRVKLLEEENSLLAKEVQALRCSNHRASTQRTGLEEELRRVRLEVEAAWRDRAHTELEVGRLSQELQALDLQRQTEAQARMKARTKVEQSRKELEEEQRAQVWLREKVNQLEHEMEHLICSHREDVAHLEATLAQSRTTIVPPISSQRGNQTPNLLQMGHEYSQRANKAWQEAAEVYQGQLVRLEESLNQTRNRLTQVTQEKNESQLRLRALSQEIASAQEVRLHLEKSLAQQGHRCSEEIQQLQEHLGGLEVEREELGQQINQIVLEKRDLLQVKMSLGLEVATYRALLDGEILHGDISLKNQPRNISITDAVFSPLGVKRNYQTQLSPNHKTTSLSSVRGVKGTELAAVNSTPVWSRKPEVFTEPPKISSAKPTASETPYPKILQDGAVESFRPQEVQEKVTYAEPLSPPNEQEDPGETITADREGPVGAEALEQRQIVESLVSHQVQCVQSAEPTFSNPLEVNTYNTEPHGDESDKDVPFKIKAENEDVGGPHAPIDAWVEKEVEHVQEETSDSGTEAVLEPNFESRTSSPVSEYEPEEGAFNNATEFSPDDYVLKDEAVEVRQETSCSVVGRNEEEVEDKLYTDGEEMDTWDSVIERKVDLKTDDEKEKNKEKRSHAEPEEDISPKEQRQENVEMKDPEPEDNMITQVEDTGNILLAQDKEENDEEEDSQNISVSWRTELESDSYAQDNTLADTRPLIRYKSDDTDANTQASHMDESESSEGEEKKAGEMGSGMWSEDKAKRFGTMEDLCEEVEEEAVDQDYELEYSHSEDRRDEREQTTYEAEDRREVVKGNSDEETEEMTEPIIPKSLDYDEELETDRLVEQELEDLAIDSFSAHFAQKMVRQSEEMQHLEEEEEEEEMSSCVKVNQELTSSTATMDQPHNDIQFSDSSVSREEVQEDQTDQQAKEEEEEHNVSMVTHADVAEDGFGFDDISSRPGVEETNDSEEVETLLPTEMEDGEPQEDLCRFPGVSEAGEWEVLENQGEDFESRDQGEDFEDRDNISESETLCKEELIESGPDEGDIFVVKNPTQLLETEKQNDLHEFLSSGVKSDFWVSSLETGATNQPACNEEQNSQNLEFRDNLVWGELENPNLVNWNSRVDVAQTEQEQLEVKKVVCRKVVEGESGESEGEGGSWSSGEEPA